MWTCWSASGRSVRIQRRTVSASLRDAVSSSTRSGNRRVVVSSEARSMEAGAACRTDLRNQLTVASFLEQRDDRVSVTCPPGVRSCRDPAHADERMCVLAMPLVSGRQSACPLRVSVDLAPSAALIGPDPQHHACCRQSGSRATGHRVTGLADPRFDDSRRCPSCRWWSARLAGARSQPPPPGWPRRACRGCARRARTRSSAR